MSSPNTEFLEQQLRSHIKGFSEGIFLTVNTQHKFDVSEVFDTRLYDFTNNKLRELSNRIHRYCFGRSYIRNEKRLNIISAIEIGEDRQRLHAHCVMLHQGDTNRTNKQMSDFVLKNCTEIFKLRGESAFLAEKFDPERFWATYFVKETRKMFYLHNGFMNIDLH